MKYYNISMISNYSKKKLWMNLRNSTQEETKNHKLTCFSKFEILKITA